MPTIIHSAQGGAGCTTTAVALALLLKDRTPVHLWCDNDGLAHLGLPSVDRGSAPVVDAACITIHHEHAGDIDQAVAIERSGARCIVDWGRHVIPPEFTEPDWFRVLTLDNSYIGLRNAIQAPTYEHAVCLVRPSRSLQVYDVSAVLADIPITFVPYGENVARASDAGLLAARLPTGLSDALEPLASMVLISDGCVR